LKQILKNRNVEKSFLRLRPCSKIKKNSFGIFCISQLATNTGFVLAMEKDGYHSVSPCKKLLLCVEKFYM
jgi:hypothetical protein